MKAIKHNKLRFLSIVLNDFLTFLLSGAAYSFFFMQIFPMLEQISKLTGLKVLQSFDAQTEDQIMQVAASILDFTKLYDEIILQVIYFSLSLLIIWIVLQSISWHNSYKIIHSDKKSNIKINIKTKFTIRAKAFAVYFLKFTTVSIIAFILMIILIYLSFKALFVLTFTQAAIKPEFTPYLVPVLIVIVLYFTTAAYTQINNLVSNTALRKENLKQFKSMIKSSINLNTFAIFLISLAFIAIFAVLITLFARYLGMAAGASLLVVTPIIMLEFPLIAFARLWLLTETSQTK
ncbi:hypothetical protein HYU06_06635 [Candidatus Woesearchaeota archaeon]|nr:hypothetical protein [Candidatus Woesearchaeota archaeon]